MHLACTGSASAIVAQFLRLIVTFDSLATNQSIMMAVGAARQQTLAAVLLCLSLLSLRVATAAEAGKQPKQVEVDAYALVQVPGCNVGKPNSLVLPPGRLCNHPRAMVVPSSIAGGQLCLAICQQSASNATASSPSLTAAGGEAAAVPQHYLLTQLSVCLLLLPPFPCCCCCCRRCPERV